MSVRELAAAAALFLPFCANAGDDPFLAIRNNDLPSLKSQMAKGLDVNRRDRRGATLLMHAAAFGSPEAMKLLLDAGADVNAKSQLEATALIWGAADPAKVRLLVDRGADVNARSKLGRTPLMSAAAIAGASETVRLLLAKGADPQAKDTHGNSALLTAADAGDPETVRLLLEKGLDANSADEGGNTALMSAAGNCDLEAVKLLLAKGADVNAANRFGGKVKNGPIALTKLTALHLAAPFGSPELIRTLLAAGAKVNALDVRGMTPLMLAVASERQDPRVVRLLLDAGAEANGRSDAGETALDWARKFGSRRVVAMLQAAGAKEALAYAPPQRGDGPEPRDARTAVMRSVPLLQRSAAEFFRQGGCAACHHQNMSAVAVGAARASGIPVDEATAQESQKTVKAQWTGFREMLLERISFGGGADQLIFALLGLAAEGAPPDEVTDAMAAEIAAEQRADGSWYLGGISRAPMEESHISRTALAIRGLKIYGPPGRKAEFDRRLARATAWLLESEPATTDERAMYLAGLHWAGVDRAKVRRAAEALKAEQRADGGWAQNANLSSDAFATGEALYALHESGTASPADAVYRRGVGFLRRTQFPDGSWYVRSRAPKFQPYFQSGFPYEHDQWISASATAWAVAALAPAAGAERRAAR